MLGRIVEVSNDKRHLSVYRALMLVHSAGEDRQEVERVPLDEIAALIANAHGLSYIISFQGRRKEPAKKHRISSICSLREAIL